MQIEIVEEMVKVCDLTISEQLYVFNRLEPIFRLKPVRERSLSLGEISDYILSHIENSIKFSEERELILEAVEKVLEKNVEENE